MCNGQLVSQRENHLSQRRYLPESGLEISSLFVAHRRVQQNAAPCGWWLDASVNVLHDWLIANGNLLRAPWIREALSSAAQRRQPLSVLARACHRGDAARHHEDQTFVRCVDRAAPVSSWATDAGVEGDGVRQSGRVGPATIGTPACRRESRLRRVARRGLLTGLAQLNPA